MNRRKEIALELVDLMNQVSDEELQALKKEIDSANRIFTAGMGRSGFMMRGFAMRLMHMGYKTYVVGETTTPAILEGDLLILGSGSAKTGSLMAMAKKAKEMGARVAILTYNKNVGISLIADCVVGIGKPKEDKGSGGDSIQPMGSLFEQGLLITCDSVILDIMDTIDTDSQEMFKNHANLE